MVMRTTITAFETIKDFDEHNEDFLRYGKSAEQTILSLGSRLRKDFCLKKIGCVKQKLLRL